MRVCVFSERLCRPFDEGIKNFAVHLIRALAAEHEVLALTSGGLDEPQDGIQNVDANRMLIGARLAGAINRFQPQAIIYVPTACATVFSFARARVLGLYGRGARVALITLQPRHHTAWGKWLLGRLAPGWVLAQSGRTAQALREAGCRTALVPPAVDAQRFQPASLPEKAALRNTFGIPAAATVVAHVGHLKGKRNLSRLLELQRAGSYHVLVVGSTSTEQDTMLTGTLRGAGATVIDTYVSKIEDVYRLSDVYLFLAEEETAAIDMPLSVLEAMASNLPTICTPFGGLPDFFPEGNGLFYLHERTELRGLVAAAATSPRATRTLVQSRTWSAAAHSVLQALQ